VWPDETLDEVQRTVLSRSGQGMRTSMVMVAVMSRKDVSCMTLCKPVA
jgi:hypothetical protein